MPEAAEAQLKVANIHYQEMEKADRDYTHAMRAEEEYRSLIQEYPDSKLVPEAKQRLREVQEVLADREFGIGRFYYLRLAYPAAIARLKTLVDRYPLYSGADQALFLLGQSYEGEINVVRKNGRMNEVTKGRMIDELTKDAAESYAKIITRYPAMDRALDAKARLEALHQPVPRPTRAMLKQNQAEVASRHEAGTLSTIRTWPRPHTWATRRWWIRRRPIRAMWYGARHARGKWGAATIRSVWKRSVGR
jgi:outer membrane protein assembly factor BamD